MRGKGGKEPDGTTPFTATPGKEKTRYKTSILRKIAGNGAGDGGLSGASHTLQPKDVFAARILAPGRNPFEEIDSGALEALRIMLIVIRVEGSAIGIGQLGQVPFLVGKIQVLLESLERNERYAKTSKKRTSPLCQPHYPLVQPQSLL